MTYGNGQILQGARPWGRRLDGWDFEGAVLSFEWKTVGIWVLMGPCCLQRRIRGRENCEHETCHPVLCQHRSHR